MNKRSVIIIYILFIIGGCASLPKESLLISKMSVQNNLELINGKYKINIINNDFSEINSIIEIVNRKPNILFKIDTDYWIPIDTIKYHTLSIEIINNGILFTMFEDKTELVKKFVLIKSIKDNYIYLKNKNIKIHNIPFILGGYEYLLTRIAISENGNLIIDSVDYSIGSFMFFIWSGTPTRKSSHIYERIKNTQ